MFESPTLSSLIIYFFLAVSLGPVKDKLRHIKNVKSLSKNPFEFGSAKQEVPDRSPGEETVTEEVPERRQETVAWL